MDPVRIVNLPTPVAQGPRLSTGEFLSLFAQACGSAGGVMRQGANGPICGLPPR